MPIFNELTPSCHKILSADPTHREENAVAAALGKKKEEDEKAELDQKLDDGLT